MEKYLLVSNYLRILLQKLQNGDLGWIQIKTKIVTDNLYYCLEKIYAQKRAKNIQIKTSGGLT
jgi:hypothetical protein